MDNNFIPAGKTRTIPDNVMYRMEPPFGEELILASAYEKPFSFSYPPTAVPLSEDTITRSLQAENESNEGISPNATARFSYTVLSRF